MARGWESKSVESQQEEHARAPAAAVAVPPEQRERIARRRTLELQRAKALADLARVTRPGHRAMLERALQEIEMQLREP